LLEQIDRQTDIDTGTDTAEHNTCRADNEKHYKPHVLEWYEDIVRILDTAFFNTPPPWGA